MALVTKRFEGVIVLKINHGVIREGFLGLVPMLNGDVGFCLEDLHPEFGVVIISLRPIMFIVAIGRSFLICNLLINFIIFAKKQYSFADIFQNYKKY